jgi:hypothetical protein
MTFIHVICGMLVLLFAVVLWGVLLDDMLRGLHFFMRAILLVVFGLLAGFAGDAHEYLAGFFFVSAIGVCPKVVQEEPH